MGISEGGGEEGDGSEIYCEMNKKGTVFFFFFFQAEDGIRDRFT